MEGFKAYQAFLILTGIVVLINQAAAQPPPTLADGGFSVCSNLRECLIITDEGCDDGERRVCMTISDSADCQLLADSTLHAVCPSKPLPVPDPIPAIEDLPLGTAFCQTFQADQDVPDGAGFYIADLPNGNEDNVVATLNDDKFPSGATEVTCTGTTTTEDQCGVTNPGANRNIYIEFTFDIKTCTTTTTSTTTTTTTAPTTTTTTAPTTTTTTAPTTTTTAQTTTTTPPATITTTTTSATTTTTPPATTATTTTAATTRALPVIPSRAPAGGCTRAPGPCSVTCGEGTRSTVKTCGRRSVTDTEMCQKQPCITTPAPPTTNPGSGKVNGGYGPWSGFSGCSQSCQTPGLATPVKARVRVCNYPSPARGGLSCINGGLGEAEQRISCTELPVCPTRAPPTSPPIQPPVQPTVGPVIVRCGYNERRCGQYCCPKKRGGRNRGAARQQGRGRRNRQQQRKNKKQKTRRGKQNKQKNKQKNQQRG